MPYKDKERRNKASRDSMERKRKGLTNREVVEHTVSAVMGLTSGVNKAEGVTWETMPLKDIKSALPQDIIDYIESVGSRYGLIEQRLRGAYKYQVWYDANFINGIHRGSKYRQYAEATK